MDRSTRAVATQVGIQLFAGGGETGANLAAIDWDATALGPVEGWPQSLRTSLRIVLTSRHPMIIWWGPDLTFFYNDAYSPTLGPRHPWALGKPGQQVWPEIWPVIGPMLEGVLSTGKPTWSDDELLYLERNGYPEETYHTFSYSPIEDEAGAVVGVFTAVNETTQRVLASRWARTARDLAAAVNGARDVDDVFARAAHTLEDETDDIPFALIYRVEGDGASARLSAAAVLEAGGPLSPKQVDLGAESTPWPLALVARTNQMAVVEGLDAGQPGVVLRRGQDVLPHTALVLPLTEPGYAHPEAIMIVGISPRRMLVDEYRAFLELLASHLATAMASAQAHEQDRKRAEALAEIDRAKTVFFSNVSHEFRTPLTLMLAPLEELLREEDAFPDARRDDLQLIHRNSLRLLKLVNGLLDFSRIEAGRSQAAFAPTDLATLTTDLAGSFRSVIERAGLRLRVDCPPLDETVYVDPSMWEKIVLNLLSNAFKFTFEGEIAVALRREGEQVRLRVSDTGTGIPPEELPRLFERFHRVQGATSRTFEGSGIGLALVQELVRLHGGEIAVESVVGEGTSFTITIPAGVAHLPAERVAVQALPVASSQSAAYVEEARRWLPEADDGLESALLGAVELPATNLRSSLEHSATDALAARVLVVDDNTDLREYLCRLLGMRYRVSSAANGREALESVRRSPPDLVLTDVMMPELDGFGLLAALRADEALREIPVIMLSARAGEEATIEGLERGVDDYLVKPFSSNEVLARVAVHVERARLRQEARRGEERFRTMADSAPVMIWMTGPDAEIVYLNKRWLEFTGRPLNQEMGASWLEGVHPDDRACCTDAYQAAFEARREYSVDYRLLRADGEYRWIVNNGVPLFGPDGAFTGFIGGCIDITDRKRLEEQKDEFLGIASHELRTPLTSVTANIQLAERTVRTILGEVARESAQAGDAEAKLRRTYGLLERAGRQVSRLDRLVSDLLDVSRIEAGKLALRPEPCDLIAIAREAVQEQRAGWPNRDISLDAPKGHASVMLVADADRIGQVVTNYVGNALKYSEETQPVAVKVRMRKGWARLEVRDAGPGLTPAQREGLFERFYRVPGIEQRSGSGVGLGLGLYICRTIIERHGGTVGVESADGTGSTFWFELPLSHED